MTHPPARGGSSATVPGGSWDWPHARARCLRLAQQLLRHPEDAEEAVQEAMIRAWRARDDCRAPAARTAWLLQITRREAFRVAERRRRLRDREQLDSQDGELVSIRQCELDGVESKVSFDQALRLLQPHDRDLVRLRYAEDLTQEQLAARLALPEGTVKVRLHRARERLRKALEENL